jgi:hypothetical protein
MTTLADRASTLARNGQASPAQARPRQTDPAPAPVQPETYAPAEVDIPEPPAGGPPEVPVHVAWSRVMGTVRYIGKDQKVTEGPARFNYRGVDDALNVFGPACRLHGVLVLPTKVDPTYRDTKTSTGKSTRECTVVVTYRIYGPKGDHIEVQAAGESLDSGDKGSAKAQAVALRTLLMHGGLVPTGDMDPDSQNVERGEAVVRPPSSYRDEIVHPATTRQRMAQIHHEIRQYRMVGALVTNGVGDEEPLGALLDRTGRERFAPKSAPPAPAVPTAPAADFPVEEPNEPNWEPA